MGGGAKVKVWKRGLGGDQKGLEKPLLTSQPEAEKSELADKCKKPSTSGH